MKDMPMQCQRSDKEIIKKIQKRANAVPIQCKKKWQRKEEETIKEVPLQCQRRNK